MRLGKLTKGTVLNPAVTMMQVGMYLNVPVDTDGVDAARLGAIRYAEDYTRRALDNAMYTLKVVGAAGGEYILLPDQDVTALGSPSLTDGTALNTLDGVVTLEDTPADPYTLALTMGGVGAAVTQALLYLVAVYWDGEVPAILPSVYQRSLDEAKRITRNRGLPKQVFDYDPSTGLYT